jgi:hypothetical protein
VKRILQIAAVAQVLLCVWLVVRIADVASTEPPSFPELYQSDAKLGLPPAPVRTRVPPAVIADITKKDLFDIMRGERPVEADALAEGDIEFEEPPVPPPTTIELAGVLLLPPDPIAILSDAATGAEQRRLRTGDLIGDYEVGTISADSVELKGAEGQSFNVSLQVRPGDSPGGQPAVRPGQATKPKPPARPALAAPAAARNDAEGNKPMNPRERAAAIARARRGDNEDEAEAEGENPVQARLEALRRLREAAQNR